MFISFIYLFICFEEVYIEITGAVVPFVTSPLVDSDFSLSCGGQVPVDSHILSAVL